MSIKTPTLLQIALDDARIEINNCLIDSFCAILNKEHTHDLAEPIMALYGRLADLERVYPNLINVQNEILNPPFPDAKDSFAMTERDVSMPELYFHVQKLPADITRPNAIERFFGIYRPEYGRIMVFEFYYKLDKQITLYTLPRIEIHGCQFREGPKQYTTAVFDASKETFEAFIIEHFDVARQSQYPHYVSRKVMYDIIAFETRYAAVDIECNEYVSQTDELVEIYTGPMANRILVSNYQRGVLTDGREVIQFKLTSPSGNPYLITAIRMEPGFYYYSCIKLKTKDTKITLSSITSFLDTTWERSRARLITALSR